MFIFNKKNTQTHTQLHSLKERSFLCEESCRAKLDLDKQEYIKYQVHHTHTCTTQILFNVQPSNNQQFTHSHEQTLAHLFWKDEKNCVFYLKVSKAKEPTTNIYIFVLKINRHT